MVKVSPAIIYKMTFDYPDSKANSQKGFTGYVDYIDREEAKEQSQSELFTNQEVEQEPDVAFGELSNQNLYQYYMDYMGDAKKQGQLFDEQTDYLKGDSLKHKRDLFSKAEVNGSPLWESVFSFDNSWLEEQGVYDPKTHWLNEKVMKNHVRKAAEALMKNEKLRNPVWTASFHYNTDNLHVHIATVELDPSHLPLVHAQDKDTREYLYHEDGQPILQRKGSWKEGTLKKMRSTYANQMVNRKKEYQRIDELIRGTAREIRTVDLSYMKETERLFQLALEHMPDDLRNWQYGKIVVNEARPYIDQIVDKYIEAFHQEEYEELVSLLDEQVIVNTRLYGEESNSHAYKENKLQDFKERMGSSVVTMLREFRKEERQGNQNIFHVRLQKAMQKKGEKVQRELPPSFYTQRMNRNTMAMKQAAFQLNRVMRKSFHEHQKDRNLAEFDRMLEGYDYE